MFSFQSYALFDHALGGTIKDEYKIVSWNICNNKTEWCFGVVMKLLFSYMYTVRKSQSPHPSLKSLIFHKHV